MASNLYPHVRMTGGAYDRGLQYGEQAAPRVRRSVEAYEGVFRRWAGLQWDEVRRNAASYLPAIEGMANGTGYLNEMRGIAKGAGIEFEDVLAINVRTEVMFSAKARALGGPATPALECTSAAVLPSASSNGHTFAAQNWDWLVHARDTVVLLEVEQSEGPSFVSLVEAGLLAKFGMNSAGLAILTNALVCQDDLGEPAIPYHVMLRSLHDATSVSDALARLQAVRRSSSANYLIADRDGLAIDVEAMPGDYARLLLEQPTDGLVAHTNHFVSTRFSGRDVGLWLMPDSPFRLQSIQGFLDGQVGRIDSACLQKALALHANHPLGVCSHPLEDVDSEEQEATVASAVIDLDEWIMWVADGNPCTTGYRPIDYSSLLSPRSDSNLEGES